VPAYGKKEKGSFVCFLGEFSPRVVCLLREATFVGGEQCLRHPLKQGNFTSAHIQKHM
jgi:hypothetical protein